MNLNLNRLAIHLQYGSSLKPQRDWFILLALGIVTLFVSAVVNASIFLKVVHGEKLSNEVVAPANANAVDLSKLDAADALFAARAQSAATYAADPHFRDPSK